MAKMIRARTHLLALGFATTVAQVILLREAMAATAGSELSWGAVLALWLFGMGLGSRLGVATRLRRLAPALPSLCVIAAAAGVILFRAAPTLAGAASGEQLALWQSTWIYLLALLPSSLLGGIAFPTLAEGIGDAGRAYGIESLGAVLGGLAISVILATLNTTSGLGLAAAVTIAIWLWPISRPAAIVGVLTAAALGFGSADLLAAASWRWANRPGSLGQWRETRHQRLEVSAGTPTSIYSNGSLSATYPEAYTTPLRTHLLMLLHPSPQRVLMVGGLTDGSLVHVLAHPVESLTVVEDDPSLLRLLPQSFDQQFRDAMTDPRVATLVQDPQRALEQMDEVDLILLLDGDPSTVRRNRTRSREFLTACAQHLADDGLLVMATGVGDTYLGGAAGRLLAVLKSTVKEGFTTVVAIPGEGILLLGGREANEPSLDPTVLAERWRLREIDAPVFHPELISVLLDPGRTTSIERFLNGQSPPPNTSFRPTAVLLAAAIEEGRGAPAIVWLARRIDGARPTLLWLALAVSIFAVLAFSYFPQAAAPSAAAVVGAASMCWWLTLLFSWQARFGSVYAEVGALTGVFMGGVAAGALTAAKSESAARRLPQVLALSAVISAAIAVGAAAFAPLYTIPALLFCGGCATGAAFPGLSELCGRGSTRKGAGVTFACDEIGAAAAAALVGVIVLPKLGVHATAGGLAALQLATLVAVARAKSP